MPTFPISAALLILLAFSSPCIAQDDEGRALYLEGKSAYDEGQGTGCFKAVPLLKKYLASYTPTPEMATRIAGAINWCEGFLQDQENFSRKKEGFDQQSFKGYGWCGQIPASICMDMLRYKPKLPEDVNRLP